MEDVRKIIISNIPPYDGEYPLEDRAFNTREWRWIREVSGYMPLTLVDGERGGDPTLIVALALIAMERAGKIRRHEYRETAERLDEAPFDGSAITVYIPASDQGADDDLPLEQTNGQPGSSETRPNEKHSSSGDSSKKTTDPSEKTPASTGTSGSDTSQGSDQTTSENSPPQTSWTAPRSERVSA